MQDLTPYFLYQGDTPIRVAFTGQIERLVRWRYVCHQGVCDTIEKVLLDFGRGQYTDITIYKEGYRRVTKRFQTNEQWVRESPEWESYAQNRGKYQYGNPLILEGADNWTAFLEKIPTAPDIDLKIKIRQPQ